ncbi:MAG: 1-deoxy-D-xylulose-5-phosphate synthase [Clostridia bacterium]|nr:1-deoxy-D-xylulose-5-phosphate synthase [Clostridia bacterium]
MLDELNLPKDLSTLDAASLEAVAKEVRDRIILTTLRNGGHLASNLGVVELTTALLSVFDALQDRILFDIGHQCYAYKILTDRRDRFDGLRLTKGISGFPDPKESVYDKLVAGHAGTALPEACGYAAADKAMGVKRENVTILGDGAMGNGHTLEALNNVCLYPKQIIVFNENDFSISPADGAFTRRFLSFDKGFDGKIDEEKLADLGLAYIGRVDGHDIRSLVEAFRLAKNYDGNVLVHVKTIKGKGYALAEEDPVSKHTVGGGESFSDRLGDALVTLAEKNDKVAVVTAGMKDGNGLAEFARRFPDRFFDAGIAEGFAVSFACALARAGMKPYVVIYATFFTRAQDQILIEAKNLPITFIANRAGLVNNDGETHQGVYAYPSFAANPELELLYPSGIEEYEKMVEWSSSYDSPLAIVLPKQFYSMESDFQKPNQQYVVKKAGSKVIIAALGALAVKISSQVSEILELSGIACDVLNVRSPRHMDEFDFGDKDVYTFEEGYTQNGFAAYLSSFVKLKGSFGLTKTVAHGALEEILFDQGLSVGRIVEKIKEDYED